MRLPTLIFDVMYYFQWQEIEYFIYQNLLGIKNIMREKVNLTIHAILWKKMTVRKRKNSS